jgi:hypothetical protein
MNKLEFLMTQGAAIVARGDQPLAATAWETLDMLCDAWAYPRFAELGCYQLKFGSSGGGEVGYSLRDKESGIVVSANGRDDEGARRRCLNEIRRALEPDQRGVCFPSRGSLHSAMCTCAAQRHRDGNLAIGLWDEDSDLELELGYSREEIEQISPTILPGPRSRPSDLTG